MIFFQIFFQFRHIKRVAVVGGVKNRLSAVHGHEPGKAFSVFSVIHYKHAVSLFGERRTGRFQS